MVLRSWYFQLLEQQLRCF